MNSHYLRCIGGVDCIVPNYLRHSKCVAGDKPVNGERSYERQYVPALTPLSIFSYSFRGHRSVAGDGNRSATKLLIIVIEIWDFKVISK